MSKMEKKKTSTNPLAPCAPRRENVLVAFEDLKGLARVEASENEGEEVEERNQDAGAEAEKDKWGRDTWGR